MKKIIYNPENPNGLELDLTAEEISYKETMAVEDEQIATEKAEAETQAQANKEAKETLKASAKAKLIAGEALTEEEADTIVI